MNWHIEFMITGKRLESTLAFIHALKPDGLRVQPVAVAAKSQNGGQGTKIVAIMEAKKGTWDSRAIAEALGITPKRAGVAMAQLALSKRIRRIKPGTFAALVSKKHG